MAPGISDKQYIVAHNLIKAHAKAYRLYQADFKSQQQGKCTKGSYRPLVDSFINEFNQSSMEKPPFK